MRNVASNYKGGKEIWHFYFKTYVEFMSIVFCDRYMFLQFPRNQVCRPSLPSLSSQTFCLYQGVYIIVGQTLIPFSFMLQVSMRSMIYNSLVNSSMLNSTFHRYPCKFKSIVTSNVSLFASFFVFGHILNPSFMMGLLLCVYERGIVCVCVCVCVQKISISTCFYSFLN